jgi:predicted metal-dependent hydrolase
MSTKTVDVPDIGKVQLTKRRSSRSIRISISVDGHVKVSMPSWVPYRAGLAFVEQKKYWIDEQRTTRTSLLEHSQAIGKRHVLHFIADSSMEKPRTRVNQAEVIVRHPPEMASNHPEVQSAAVKAGKKALQKQADDYLPERLKLLSASLNLPYRSLSIRQLKSRWGSCSNAHHITLNYFLMILPEELIDYVLVHELAHTKHLNHSKEFWQLVSLHVDNVSVVRKRLRQYQPSVFVQQA